MRDCLLRSLRLKVYESAWRWRGIVMHSQVKSLDLENEFTCVRLPFFFPV